jgi:hypothetical protein
MLSKDPLKYEMLCKKCYELALNPPPDLVEIFAQHTPIVEGSSQMNRYKADYIITKKAKPKVLTVDDLNTYVKNLQKRYPSSGFMLDKIEIDDKKLHIITNKTKDAVPIYIDLEEQKFYIRRQDLMDKPRLTNYIIMVTLGSLGISQSKYADGLRR